MGDGGAPPPAAFTRWSAMKRSELVFTLQSSGKVSDREAICPTDLECPDDDQVRILNLTSEARAASTIGTVGFIAGGVLAAGGLVLVFTAPSGASHTAFAPALGSGFAGLSATQSW